MIRQATFVLILFLWMVGFRASAGAEEVVGCRIVEVSHGAYNEATYTKVCWLIGSDGVHVLIETEPPVLYPQLGNNADGSECWYWTSTVTPWVIISREGSVARIGQDIGVAILLGASIDACVGIPGEDLRLVAWDYLEQWLLVEPQVEFSPASRGVTGLETYGWAPIPDRIDATLISPLGTTLEVRAWIDQVAVDWGDATAAPLVLNESQLGRFAAYPEGSAFHVYETKTCKREGQTGCYAEVDGYSVTVTFRWQAAYRVGANPWIDIGPVTPSSTLAYPVDEIVSRIETTG